MNSLGVDAVALFTISLRRPVVAALFVRLVIVLLSSPTRDSVGAVDVPRSRRTLSDTVMSDKLANVKREDSLEMRSLFFTSSSPGS